MKSAVLLLGLSVVLLAGGCGSSGNGAAQAHPDANSADTPGTEYVPPDAKGVQTMTVKSAPIPEYLDLPAHIEADPTRVVHVFAPAGGRIVEMKVRPWDRVEKGQTLAMLESSDLARAVADYHKALVDNQVKQKALDPSAGFVRAQRDLRKRFAAGAGRRGAWRRPKSRPRANRCKCSAWTRITLDTDLRVTAPRSGVVLDVGAASGEFSKSLRAPAPLCTIADITTVWAVGDIYEKDLAAAKSGEPAEVTLERISGPALAGTRERGFGCGGSHDAHAARSRGAAESDMRRSSRRCSERFASCGRPRPESWCRPAP